MIDTQTEVKAQMRTYDQVFSGHMLYPLYHGGRGNPEVECWTSDHCFAGSNPL